jgi:hypothetical protein
MPLVWFDQISKFLMAVHGTMKLGNTCVGAADSNWAGSTSYLGSEVADSLGCPDGFTILPYNTA